MYQGYMEADSSYFLSLGEKKGKQLSDRKDREEGEEGSINEDLKISHLGEYTELGTHPSRLPGSTTGSLEVNNHSASDLLG